MLNKIIKRSNYFYKSENSLICLKPSNGFPSHSKSKVFQSPAWLPATTSLWFHLIISLCPQGTLATWVFLLFIKRAGMLLLLLRPLYNCSLHLVTPPPTASLWPPYLKVNLAPHNLAFLIPLPSWFLFFSTLSAFTPLITVYILHTIYYSSLVECKLYDSTDIQYCAQCYISIYCYYSRYSTGIRWLNIWVQLFWSSPPQGWRFLWLSKTGLIDVLLAMPVTPCNSVNCMFKYWFL